MHKMVMLVDDSEIDNLVHRKILQLSGLAESIKAWTQPRQALAWLAELTAQQTRWPDRILLDLNIPPMTGFEFLESMEQLALEAGPLAPSEPFVVILTSSVDQRDIDRARHYGSVARFLHKPLTIAGLEGLGCRINPMLAPRLTQTA